MSPGCKVTSRNDLASTSDGEFTVREVSFGADLDNGIVRKENHISSPPIPFGHTYASIYLTPKRNAALSHDSPFHAQKSSLSNGSFLSPATTIAHHLSSICPIHHCGT